ncbi:hypothetical protein L208DRAFT_1264094 [Tricholoma matsutake]|nr:hypothetical protein L208DRAFT_1264094 [Tricholoma matsutake 945]
MAGSDYDSGILGYGASTTHGLAKCGFGDALLTAANALPDNDSFQMFLSAWRAQMHLELSTNLHGFLPHRSIVQASKLKVSALPNVDVLNLYLHPKTSWTVGLGAHVRDTIATSWQLHESVIHEITTFCQQHLGWSDLAALLKRFKNVLWGGVICMFCSPLVLFDDIEHNLATPNTRTHVLKISPKPRTVQSSNGTTFTYQRLTVTIRDFVHLMGCIVPPENNPSISINLWVPQSLTCSVGLTTLEDWLHAVSRFQHYTVKY